MSSEMNNQSNDVHKCELSDISYIGNRNALVFSFDTAHAAPEEELSDEFFDLTEEDARKILRDIVRKREELEEGGPLVTAKLREAEESKKLLEQLNRYQKTIIRVMFPDRSVLQAVFSPTETIKEVIKFVSEYLENKSLLFYLYTTPPKCILPEDKKLIELNCVPRALLYFGTQEAQEKQNFLREDILQQLTTHSKASLIASKLREQARVEANTNDDQAECSKPLEKIKEAKTKKVPKWFKPL